MKTIIGLVTMGMFLMLLWSGIAIALERVVQPKPVVVVKGTGLKVEPCWSTSLKETGLAGNTCPSQ